MSGIGAALPQPPLAAWIYENSRTRFQNVCEVSSVLRTAVKWGHLQDNLLGTSTCRR